MERWLIKTHRFDRAPHVKLATSSSLRSNVPYGTFSGKSLFELKQVFRQEHLMQLRVQSWTPPREVHAEKPVRHSTRIASSSNVPRGTCCGWKLRCSMWNTAPVSEISLFVVERLAAFRLYGSCLMASCLLRRLHQNTALPSLGLSLYAGKTLASPKIKWDVLSQ